MKKELTSFQKGKIVLGIIENLQNLPNKGVVYINERYYDNGVLFKKIATKAGIQTSDYLGDGMVDITEDISISLDDRIRSAEDKLNGYTRNSSSEGREFVVDVDEAIKIASDEFEKKNIPSHGPSKTHLGEIFRAIQYIQYRAHNDGDLCWYPGSPTFTSYVYLKSQIDRLNYSGQAYDDETGGYGFKFTDPHFIKYGWDGNISDVIEDNLALTANFIKYQIMDLILNGKLQDTPNEFDSRDFKSLKEDRY
jgi:hypothetical protein